jgi:uncharacterized protein YbjT (DUF2867 family)
MRVLLFGATGMVGEAALRECLLDPDVTEVLAAGRSATGRRHPKLRDLLVPDLADLTRVESELGGFDAAIFTVGVSSARMSEQRYTELTLDLTLSVARTLARLNPAMTFIYVSGQGTDSSEAGRMMWARVKGRTENELLALPFAGAYMFRPGVILPLHGITSRTRLYRMAYLLAAPFAPLLRHFPRFVTTTDELGRAMLWVARHGFRTRVLESRDIAEAAELAHAA